MVQNSIGGEKSQGTCFVTLATKEDKVDAYGDCGKKTLRKGKNASLPLLALKGQKRDNGE